MTLLLIITGLALVASFAADAGKTRKGIIKGLKMFAGILPMLAGVLAFVSVVMAALSPETIRLALGGGGVFSFITALGVGSIALIPGFIAYPLASVLKSNGATVPILSAFITTLMMVGVVTLPIEARFLGWRIALLRNLLAFVGAVLVAVAMTWVLA